MRCPLDTAARAAVLVLSEVDRIDVPGDHVHAVDDRWDPMRPEIRAEAARREIEGSPSALLTGAGSTRTAGLGGGSGRRPR